MRATTLGAMARVLGLRATAEQDAIEVTGISTDTRTIQEGDVFVALDGPRHRGSDYLGTAFAMGAVAAISPREAPVGPSRRVLVVKDTLRALAALARAERSQLDAMVVAVTGSTGKTTTKDAIAALLSSRYRVTAARESFNNAIGVPLTILESSADTEALVVEIGTSAPGEIRALAGIARPTIAVITAVVPAHLDGLGTVDGVLAEKLSLAEMVEPGGVVCINADDERLDAAIDDVARRNDLRVVRYGFGPSATLKGIEVRVRPTGGSFRLTPGGEVISAPLLGKHNLSNLLGAVSVALEADVPVEAIVQASALVLPPPMRMEVRNVAGMRVVYDCYNANPVSMSAALDAWTSCRRIGRRVAILGDMLELGAESEFCHKQLGARLATVDADVFILVGPSSRATYDVAIENGIPASRLHWASDVEEARAIAGDVLLAGDDVLLKASRGIALERVLMGIAPATVAAVGSSGGID